MEADVFSGVVWPMNVSPGVREPCPCCRCSHGHWLCAAPASVRLPAWRGALSAVKYGCPVRRYPAVCGFNSLLFNGFGAGCFSRLRQMRIRRHQACTPRKWERSVGTLAVARPVSPVAVAVWGALRTGTQPAVGLGRRVETGFWPVCRDS